MFPDKFLRQLALIIALGLIPLLAEGELFSYTDASGTTHFVDSFEKVPAEFRATAKSDRGMPTVSRVPGRNYEKSAPGQYPVEGVRRNQSVEVFVTAWCRYCQQLEGFLKQNNIPYTRYDVEKDSTGRGLYRSLGGGGVPIVKIGSQVFRGFDESELRQALGM